ncbi:hypothetical protein STM14_2524 [Salmonella enterica subsp. enterica serovar Typhimurium str. 14028S]|nr:hypothetical protein STM14_2524 [Salmonella enterica subsp. enterica serovar Typhimurium str. 14028S]
MKYSVRKDKFYYALSIRFIVNIPVRMSRLTSDEQPLRLLLTEM